MRILKLTLKNPDKVGVFASGLCLVHCLLAPFLYLLIGKSTAFTNWYGSIDIILIVVSFIAIRRSAKLSSRNYMKVGFYIAWFALFFTLTNEKFLWLALPEILTYVFAISLAVLHLYNRKFCKCDADKCCH